MTERAATDRDLIGRYLAGDVAAFDELMGAHEDRVFSICLRMLRERQAALDATQDTFLTVFRKADRYRAEAAFSTWLYRVTVNTCYDHLRRAARKRTEPIPEGVETPDRATESALAAAEMRPAIESALMTLGNDFRAAVILVDLEGMSLEQAADTLDVPIGTVKSRVFRGRRQLASELGNFAPDRNHPTEER